MNTITANNNNTPSTRNL